MKPRYFGENQSRELLPKVRFFATASWGNIKDKMSGLFLTIEGADGCGKSTVISLLQQKLQDRDVLFLREPGGTDLGETLRRDLLLDTKWKDRICPRSEAELFLAARYQIVAEKIAPAVKNGKIVICDRYHDSTLAYQGGGRGLELNWQEDLVSPGIDVQTDLGRYLQEMLDIKNRAQYHLHPQAKICLERATRFQRQEEFGEVGVVTQKGSSWPGSLLRPDRTFMLRLAPELAWARLNRAGKELDRMESEGPEFQDKVRQEYDRLAAAEPSRFVCLDARQTPEALVAQVVVEIGVMERGL